MTTTDLGAAAPPATFVHCPDLYARADVELVAMLLSSRDDPTAIRRALPKAALLLERVGGLACLARADPLELGELLARAGHPVPLRRAWVITASFEIARRARATAPGRIRSSADAAAWAMPRVGTLEHEELWMLALDGQSRLVGARQVAKGGVHGLSVRAAEPLRAALRASASGFVLVHNHPSGDPTPSPEDVEFTEAVANAAAVVGVPLLDHVVVTRDTFASVPARS